MEVDTIDEIKQFSALKDVWDKIYIADNNATVFISWDFINGWIAKNKNRWIILAARSNGCEDYVAFFFLVKNDDGRVLKTCDSAVTDHTSFICYPEYERDAVYAFAFFIQNHLTWQKLKLLEMMDPRISFFLKYFPQNKYHIRESARTVCPYIPLECSWEDYLLKRLNQKRRWYLRRYLRRIDDQKELNVINTQTEDFENHIESLLKLWQTRWGDVPRQKLETLRSIFQCCFENNHLLLHILLYRNDLIAASIGFVDYEKKCLYSFISGWDDTYKKLAPGNVLAAFGIRNAIENGFKEYDFLRGDEAYKYASFGCINRYNKNILIKKKGPHSVLGKLKSHICRSIRQI